MAMSDDRLRSKTLKRLINEIKIDYLRQGKTPPSTEKIIRLVFKKYNIRKEDILYDRFIRL